MEAQSVPEMKVFWVADGPETELKKSISALISEYLSSFERTQEDKQSLLLAAVQKVVQSR